MDALSELLRVIRLTGTAFIDAELTAPWAIQTPPPSVLAARLAPGARKIIPYHLVSEGGCFIEVKGQPPIQVEAPEVVLFPHGDVHVLSSAPGLEPLQITTEAVIRLTRPDSIARARYGGNGTKTRLICGFFACEELLSGQLIQRLPHVMRCKLAADSSATLLLRSLAPTKGGASPGSGAVMGKLAELLFVDAVRLFVEDKSNDDGWLAGLRDRYASQAIALIYAKPDAPWTLGSLAKAVGLSRTALAEHFARCTGVPPMQFLAQWRLRLAAEALRHTDRPIKNVAENAGFSSTAAFTRAFGREFGASPASWRGKAGRGGAGRPATRRLNPEKPSLAS
ncbi:MAG TPA: AraC family transcriptional regulator [Steroidobacteraceae bacterium]|nr:AraC family transcriptional regulator [Steroidobacteraceae bacterium]